MVSLVVGVVVLGLAGVRVFLVCVFDTDVTRVAIN